jgi:predicted GNAT family N-acyltransferase
MSIPSSSVLRAWVKKLYTGAVNDYMAGSSPRRADRSQLYALLTAALRGICRRTNRPYQDVDGDDLIGENRHLLGWRGDELVACAHFEKRR